MKNEPLPTTPIRATYVPKRDEVRRSSKGWPDMRVTPPFYFTRQEKRHALH